MKPLQLDIDGVLQNKSSDIILSILRSKGVSRSQLAEQCGVSAMTAGKVVSAMLDANYAIAEHDTSAPNKRAELIKPAPDFGVIVAKLSRRKLKLFICDIGGDIILSRSKNINDSLPPEQEIIRLISSIQGELERYPSERRALAVLHGEEAAKPSSRIIANTLPFLTPCITLPSRDCAEKHINRVYPNDTTLWVKLDGAFDIRLFSEGHALNSNRTELPRMAQSDDSFVISHLAKTLSSLFNLTLPQRIIIETEDIPFDCRALDMLRAQIRSDTPLRRESLPEIIINTAPELDVKEAVDIIRRRFAGIEL